MVFRSIYILFSSGIYFDFSKFEGKVACQEVFICMESKSTRKFFNPDFIIENKLSFSSVIILQDIYFWILSKNPPKSKIINDETYYYISQTHLSNFNYGLLSQPAINWVLNKLKEIGIIKSTIVIDYHCNYINFDWSIIKKSLLDKEELKKVETNEWWKKIHDYADEQIAMKKNKNLVDEDMLNKGYEIVVKNNRNYLVKKKEVETENPIIKKEDKNMMLLDEEDMGMKPKICKEADAIAKLIIKKYYNYFPHRIPENGNKPTKTYIEICNKIADIYNGAFIKSRLYPLGLKFLNNKQFKIEGWKDKIKEVKGDWLKVRKLILGALKNFVLMHEENRLPYSKEYLQTNLNNWFYDKVSNYDEPQSQFITCLFEPEFTNKHNSEIKADRIFEELPEKAKIGGNELFELNENMSSGAFWENIKEMVEWGKLVFEKEPNIHYWVTSASEIPGEFAKYCKEKNISVSINTLDIEKAVESNSPWTWFIKDMSFKHGLNPHLSELVTVDDFLDCYKEYEDVVF